MEENKKDFGMAIEFAKDFIDNGFDQFDKLPDNLPFREDVEESFGSLYMVVRDTIIYVQEGGSISIPEMNKLAKEWNKCNEIRELVQLVNSKDLVNDWETAVLDSYENIMLFVHIFQQMFEKRYNKDE